MQEPIDRHLLSPSGLELLQGWRSGGGLSGLIRQYLIQVVLMATFGLLGGLGKNLPRTASFLNLNNLVC